MSIASWLLLYAANSLFAYWVAWEHIEALDGPSGLCYFPDAAEIIAAAGVLRR